MSTLNVDALVGNTSANAITVRGEGTATTSLQQGLLKAWGNFDGSGTVGTNDSFNMSTITDRGTGLYTSNITNNFANGNACMSGYSIMDGLVYGEAGQVSNKPRLVICKKSQLPKTRTWRNSWKISEELTINHQDRDWET